MSWTYVGTPSASAREWIRFRLGDTQSDDPQLTDEEIAALLTDAGDAKRKAALFGARRLAAKYARLVDNGQGSERNSYSQRQAAYAALIKELEAEIAELGTGAEGEEGSGSSTGVGGIRATGLSLARRNVARANPDRIRPSAYRGQWTQDGQDD